MWEDEQDGVSSGWEVKEEGQLPNGNGHGSNGFYKRPRHVLEWNVERVRVQRGRASMDILHSVVGRVESGQLCAILGPSGSGKTTLLECIALRNRSFRGSVKYDGHMPSGEFVCTHSAFVPQRELFFNFMTVREHLLFHAVARMSHTYRREAINRRVDEVIREVKLGKCADTVVGGSGDPVFTARGLSGGERRRLALATELLSCPSVIFADEPSSGLDSVLVESIITILHDLAESGGRIVVSVLHCPSSLAVKRFAAVSLLTHDGRLAYHGPPGMAVQHFMNVGYHYPPDCNPADYWLSVISAEPDEAVVVDKQRLDHLVQCFEASDMSALLNRHSPEDEHMRYRPTQGVRASCWTLFLMNLWRCMVQYKRDFGTLLLWVVVSLLTGLLMGTVFYQQALRNWRNLVGLVFSTTVASLLLGTIGAVLRFPLEWAVLSREYLSGANAAGPYVAARFMSSMVLSVGPVIMASLMYWMTGMDTRVWEYFMFLFIFVSITLASVALGQFASSWSSNAFVGLATLPGITAPMILFSGLLYDRNLVPMWLRWLEKVSIVNYGFAALILNQCFRLPVRKECEFVLSFLEIDEGSYNVSIGMLWVINAGFQILTYLCLSVRLRRTDSSST